MKCLSERIEDTVLVVVKLAILSALIFGSLGTVIFYQAHIITQQRDLIRQMVKNPSCTMPEGK